MPEVALMVSTLLELDASVQQEVSLPITWKYINSSGALACYNPTMILKLLHLTVHPLYTTLRLISCNARSQRRLRKW
jgi:hypothetical protein